jgi:hypothetical protein
VQQNRHIRANRKCDTVNCLCSRCRIHQNRIVFFDIYRTLMLVFKDSDIIMKPSKTFVPPSGESVLARSRGVSSCHMTTNIPMWSALSRTHCAPCAGKVLDHPPHSLDLSPCDFHVFDAFKIALKGYRFWCTGPRISPWNSLWWGFISWYVSGMHASSPWGQF